LDVSGLDKSVLDNVDVHLGGCGNRAVIIVKL
jgi:hypothetical protein